MAKIELVLPAMGEGIIEATIIRWLVDEGSPVEEDQPLVEVATDKVDTEIPSPAKGILSEILMNDGETPTVGAILAIIDTGAGDEGPAPETQEDGGRPGDAGAGDEGSAPETQEDDGRPGDAGAGDEGPAPETQEDDGRPDNAVGQAEGKTVPPAGAGDPPTVPGQTPGDEPGPGEIPRQTPSGKFLTPLVRNIAKKENISARELDQIKGSGEGGRITKEDLMKYLEQKPALKTGHEAHPGAGSLTEPGGKPAGPADDTSQPAPQSTREGNRTVEMDRMRKLIAERMVRSKQISPHVTSFIDADVTGLVRWREARKDEFLLREQQKLTFTPFFIEATVKALRDYPMVNVSVDGSRIIVKKNINIGIAVAMPGGNLIVPVIKDANEKNLAGLARAVNDLAGRARSNKLQAHEISGGTFTITNFGTFGNTTGTPIINQPEVAILGTGVIQKKPVVLETGHGDVIAIRHMMTLSLAYDHRVIDGALGGMFLKRISEYLESFNATMDRT
jgi:2-oxoglutarate dehydrogenase E2 component (dihydrolipoamide succinyltransferase)